MDSEAVRLRRGDPDALVALLERYQHRLYRFLLRMVREPATAEDLFQQTWIRVAENVRRFDPNRGIEPWLFSIARNLAIDYLRRMRPESLDAPLPSGESRADTLPDPHVGREPVAFEKLLRDQTSSRLAEGVSELPAIYREVVTLRFEEEMKLEEIAGAAGRAAFHRQDAPATRARSVARFACGAVARRKVARMGAPMNDHDRIRELFPLAAAGALDESEERDLSAHLASCADCAAELEGWQRSDGSFASDAHPAGAGESCPSRAATAPHACHS